MHSNKAAQFCAKYNVTQGFTCTNTPENNQFIERVWGTLADMSSCMQEDSKRPEPYWEEARKLSQYIYNRVPATRKPDVGPWSSPPKIYCEMSRDTRLKHLTIPFVMDVMIVVPKKKREVKHHGDKSQEGVSVASRNSTYTDSVAICPPPMNS